MTQSACVLWRGALNGDGYGVQKVAGQSTVAHRVAYERRVGPIPSGMVIDHLCRNRACVNPDHMEVVTPRVNTLRGISVPALNAQKTSCKRGHEFTPENIAPRTSRSTGRGNCRICKAAHVRARQLGIPVDDYFALPPDVRAMKPRQIAAYLTEDAA